MFQYDLPEFSLVGYEKLIKSLINVGYTFNPISRMPDSVDSKTVYLRHDIDMHLAGVDRIAEIEASVGAPATYYILLTQHYNPRQSENLNILRRLVSLEHEIGLHYDLETYPEDKHESYKHLKSEVKILSDLVGFPIKTIVMHQPYRGQNDPYKMQDEFVHPHDPRYQRDLLYVSDSCRAWRDENLLSCFSSTPPLRLLLATHPELWLDGSVKDRNDYIQVMIENATHPYKTFFDNFVRQVWENHDGPRLHNMRQWENENRGTRK